MSRNVYRVQRRKIPRRKRRIPFRIVVILLLCAVVVGGIWLCASLFNRQQSPAPPAEESSAVSAVSSTESTSSQGSPVSMGSSAVSDVPSGDQSEENSAPSSQTPTASGDYSCFDQSVFLGNSVIDDLHTYNVVKNADFFARTGLTVTSVMTKPVIKGTVPAVDELKKKQYDKVFLMFGLNELGWEYPRIFQEDYAKLIDGVRERQPNAEIYIQSLTPVSAAKSQKNENNVNNPRIREYNQLLQEVAQQKNVYYLDVYSALVDDSGNLPEEASADGIHLNITYCHVWMDYICGELNKTT